MASWSLTARWVFPVSRPPLRHGRVVVAADRLVAIEPDRGEPADLDLGDAALLPALVNAHVHLDLSGFRTPVPPGPDFPAWLRTVVGHRRAATPDQTLADVRAGLDESRRAGVGLVGDVAGGGLSAAVLGDAPVRSTVFFELLGLTRERAGPQWDAALAWLRDHPPTATFRPGLTPHAPYSVRASLYRAAGRRAAGGLPVATHLAESADELALLGRRAGPFVPFLESLGVYDPAGLVAAPAEVIAALAPAPRLLLVHANYLDPETPLPPTATVVYCPRTHAAFGHPPHPYRRLLDRGVPVVLGTDGRSSNPDLDVLAEARWLRRHDATLPGDVLLRMVTLDAADALGWAAECGSLEPGKSADLAVVPLPAGDGEPHALLFDAEAAGRRYRLFRGAWDERPPG